MPTKHDIIPEADEMNGEHDITYQGVSAIFEIYWYDSSYADIAAGEPMQDGWYYDLGDGQGENGPWATSLEAFAEARTRVWEKSVAR